MEARRRASESRPRAGLLGLGLLLAVAACGDAVVIVSTNLGTVASDARCGAGEGRFDLRDQQGLVIVVFLDDDTAVFRANGSFGNCTDLVSGSAVEVRGSDTQDGIDAKEVRIR